MATSISPAASAVRPGPVQKSAAGDPAPALGARDQAAGAQHDERGGAVGARGRVAEVAAEGGAPLDRRAPDERRGVDQRRGSGGAASRCSQISAQLAAAPMVSPCLASKAIRVVSGIRLMSTT